MSYTSQHPALEADVLTSRTNPIRAVTHVATLLALSLVPAPAQDSEPAHFHHVHLNVVAPDRSIEFYTKIWGGVPVRYRGVADAVFTERSFLLFNRVDTPPEYALKSGLWHIGWGGVDVPNEAKWLKAKGVKAHTELYSVGRNWVTYWSGPDNEMIEMNTMGHHRYAHVHLMAKDVNATTGWYSKHLGLEPRLKRVPKPADMQSVRAWSNSFRCDNVSFVVYGMPNYTPRPPWWKEEPLTEFQPTKGRVIDHIGFSYRNIQPIFERMKAAGAEIVEPIAMRGGYRTRSFFVQGPDEVLIEIVEGKPIPEGVWE